MSDNVAYTMDAFSLTVTTVSLLSDPAKSGTITLASGVKATLGEQYFASYAECVVTRRRRIAESTAKVKRMLLTQQNYQRRFDLKYPLGGKDVPKQTG